MHYGLALCAGIGGLELGLRDAFGLEAACYVERDPFAAAVLVAHMGADLSRAPVWDDLRTFDARAWRGRVDWLSAGYPCQPFSVAGKRLGSDDERHLWPHVRRIIDESGVSVVFLENVQGHVSLGLANVLADLAALGFDAEWGVLGAHDVGAPHLRERLWVLAHRDGGAVRLESRRREWESRAGSTKPCDDGAMAYRDRSGLEGLRQRGLWHGERSARGDDIDGRGGAAVAAMPLERCEQSGRARHWRAGLADHRFPMGPDDIERWQSSPVAAQPAIRRGSDGLPFRVDRLRALGNAVVPQCASAAFRLLLDRAVSA